GTTTFMNYYSTQTTLADWVAKIYGRYYLYVAKSFNPTKNDPSSNPKIIRGWWCRVAASQTVYFPSTKSDIWFDHKQKLKFYAMQKERKGEISAETKERIQHEISQAQPAAASPIVYIIPRINIAPSRVRRGDPKPKYPGNEEYIIEDLRDADHFTN